MTAKNQNSIWRHTTQCSVCRSSHRREIELEFLRWKSPAAIAKQFGLGSRQVIFRHCRATGLFEKRAADVRGILVAVIERGMNVSARVSPRTIVAAATVLSKLDAAGRIIERFERIDRDSAFLDDPRWTRGQMRTFAETGALPPWAEQDVDTAARALEGGDGLN